MSGRWKGQRLVRHLVVCVSVMAAVMAWVRPVRAVVVITDGFGDADRNNDGTVAFYDTDINSSGTWNDAVEDADLADRGVVEVTAALNPSDVGIVWSGVRSFDTAANIPKATLRIINDTVATGTETASEIHNDGLALGVESRGGGSSFIGRFSQPVEVGPVAGDKLVASVDFRVWRESANPFEPPAVNELRWGLYQDTDNELGMTAPYGDGDFSGTGATVEWGKEDGNWFANQPGAEGDKGIRSLMEFGSVASEFNSRIHWEYNLAGINGAANNGRILEGNGVSDTPGSGGDTGVVASPLTTGDGPGGIIMGGTYAPHTLSIEIIRLENGLIEIATFVDGVEALRDDIKTTDTGFNVIGPPAFSYNYVAFRNTADYDYAIDNFMVEVFSSSPGLVGDHNGDGSVDAADYVVWRKTDGTQPAYATWRANFGKTLGFGSGSGATGTASASAVPEPASLVMLLVGMLAICRCRVAAVS